MTALVRSEAPVSVHYSRRTPFVCQALTNEGHRCSRRAWWSERRIHHESARAVLCDQHHHQFVRFKRILLADSDNIA